MSSRRESVLPVASDWTEDEFKDALATIVDLGPGYGVRHSAGKEGNYETYTLEGDDFSSFCHALYVVEEYGKENGFFPDWWMTNDEWLKGRRKA